MYLQMKHYIQLLVWLTQLFETEREFKTGLYEIKFFPKH